MRRLCTRSTDFTTESSDGRSLDGYAAVFDQDTVIDSWMEGRFRERITKGAFKKTLRERSPIMQYNHGNDSRVGTVPIGVYERITEDDNGLHVEGRLFENDNVEPVREAIAGGAITGMSFKFRVVRDEWRDAAGKLIKDQSKLYNMLYGESSGSDDELPTRTIKEVQLFEAGPVSTPAYAGTSVGVRSDDDTESDRQEVFAGYVRGLPAETEDPDTAQITQWLDAERAWQADCETWLDAETAHYRQWLDAAAAHRLSVIDAALSGTSTTGNRDAAPAGTSRNIKQDTPIQKGKTMRLSELKARRAAIAARFTEIGAEYRDAEMPEDVVTEFDSLERELGEVEGTIASIEARNAKLDSYAKAPAAPIERSVQPSPAFHQERDVFDIDSVRMDSTSPEDFVARLRDNASRAIDTAHFARVTKRDAAQERASELLHVYDDENGTLAKRMLATGSPVYERAFGKAMKACSTAGLTAEEQRAMSLGTDSAGGFAVPFQLDPTVILTNDGGIGGVRALARVETIVGKEWNGVTSAGITVSRDGTPAAGEIGRAAEATEVTDGSFTLAQPKIRVSRVQGFVPFSIEIDQDWGGLRSEITRMLDDAKAREEDDSFTNGTASDGVSIMPMGIVGGSTNTTSTGAGNITNSTVLALLPSLLYSTELSVGPRFRANAAWMANKAVLNLARQIGTTDGPNLWERIGNGLPAQLLGYNVHENSFMDAVAASKKILAFGDFSQYLIVDRVGMSVELVPHVFGSNGRPTGQRGVYAIWRNNAMTLVQNAIKVITTPAS